MIRYLQDSRGKHRHIHRKDCAQRLYNCLKGEHPCFIMLCSTLWIHHYCSLRLDSSTPFTKELSFYIATQITLALNFLENCDLIQFCILFMQPQQGARSNNYLLLNGATICYIPVIPYTLILAVCFINYMYDMLLSHSPARYVHLDKINPINIKKLITCSISVIGTGYTSCMKI